MFRRRQGKRRQINAGPRRDFLWRAVEWLRAGAARPVEWLRAAADAARWPLERLVWAFERRLLWPLQERVTGLPAPSLPVPSRTAGATALAAAALAAAAIGAVALTGGDSGDAGPPPVAAAPAAAPAEAPPEEPDRPALEGVPPSFGTGGVAAGATSDGGEAVADGSASSDLASADSVAAEDEEGAATASSKKPVPAGPAAMKVARRFSEAFVLYEVGERPARAMAVFAATATPRLATALAERPPRQPEGTEVPKARVLNLVPGPRRGKAYTVSASLLRVGVTSELRLELKNQAGNWVVSDVRG